MQTRSLALIVFALGCHSQETSSVATAPSSTASAPAPTPSAQSSSSYRERQRLRAEERAAKRDAERAAWGRQIQTLDKAIAEYDAGYR